MDWITRLASYANACLAQPLGYPDCNALWGGLFLAVISLAGIVALRIIYKNQHNQREEQRIIEEIIKAIKDLLQSGTVQADTSAWKSRISGWREQFPLAYEPSLPGEALFNSIRTGNGTFRASAGAANTGTGTLDGGSVVDAALIDGHRYQISFSVVAGVTTYDVADLTTSTIVSGGNAYAPGSSITVAGMQVKIAGSPASLRWPPRAWRRLSRAIVRRLRASA